MSFDHGYPVESLAVFPSLSLVVSTGGPIVKIWDVYQKKILTSLSNHTKVVTSVCFSDSASKLLTAGLDKGTGGNLIPKILFTGICYEFLIPFFQNSFLEDFTMILTIICAGVYKI